MADTPMDSANLRLLKPTDLMYSDKREANLFLMIKIIRQIVQKIIDERHVLHYNYFVIYNSVALKVNI